MNQTLKLLKVIGSPYCDIRDRDAPKNEDEAIQLYEHANKNKIALAYLLSIKDQGKLEEFNLRDRYETERIRHEKQKITAVRISALLNSLNINYAIFKSIMPFPATPNDVDIIHFGSKKDYVYICEKLLQSNYSEVKGYVDAEQSMFHDIEFGGLLEPHPEKKDVYDVDIYQKISASHVIYLDKAKFVKYIKEINISNNKIKVLVPEAEMVAIIIHSIIPEMLCTLFVYYATLYYLSQMNLRDIDSLIKIAKENQVVRSLKAHVSLIAILHKNAHGFVPKECNYILSEIGFDENETQLLLKEDFKTPHMYSSSTIFKILVDKAKDSHFLISVVRQMAYMLNPKLTKWVIYNIILRRSRDTY